MNLTEKKLARQDIYAGRVVKLHVDTVELPDGGTANRSGQFGLFGIFWFIGECCGVAAVMSALSSGKKSVKKAECLIWIQK